MVFEAIVVDLLNKFLNQYIENLDTSQLKIGIWGGDVVLADLIIKQTIFQDWNLPVKVSYGKLGKLSLKIPWKNLYGESTLAVIENLFVVFVPNTEMKYDAGKEEKWQQERKKFQLKLVEEAKKRELQKDATQTHDTFMEKLIMQIIKNIQVDIRNIHFRYEDKTTDPDMPFSVGATMSTLSVKSSLKDPFPMEFQGIGKPMDFIFKIIQLQGLAIYWNTSADLLASLKPSEQEKVLLKNIPKPNFKPEGYKYIIGPITAEGFLRLNPKPETDGTNYATPKVFILVDMEEIKLAVSRKQYRSISLLLQNLQMMSAASRYRKYRPFNVPVLGNAMIWWHFAYNAVTEDIKRRKLEWSWEHIQNHRRMCRKYAELFHTKCKSKKTPKIMEKELEDLERQLNVFDLILLREQVYVEVERLSLAEHESKAGSGWFSYLSWFSYGSGNKTDTDKEDNLVSQIEKVMTQKEKEKLYKAIDYQENFSKTNYPEYFVEFKFIFKLHALRVRVYDDKMEAQKNPTALSMSLKEVKIIFEQRPSANALKLVVELGDFSVLGKFEVGQDLPEVVKSNCTEFEKLMDVLFETNPLDGSCDQRIHVNANSLCAIYHAATVNLLLDIFKIDAEENVTTIVAATAASLPTFQEITSMGLQYAIDKSSKLELKAHILASNIIIPYGGVYEPDKEFVIVKLGQLNVTTEERAARDMSVRKLYLQGSSERDIFTTFLSASYRKFKCQLQGIQIVHRLPGEEWVSVLENLDPSPLRLLEPTNLTIIIKKCLVTDDARIPKAVIEGKLPSIALNISEDRVICLAGLVSSIPTSNTEPEMGLSKRLSTSAWSLQSFGTQLESKLRHKVQPKERIVAREDFVQGIDLVARFTMNEFVISVSKATNAAETSVSNAPNHSPALQEKFVQLSILNLESELTCKTFETVADVKLGGIEVKQNHKGISIPVVETAEPHHDYYLLLVEYTNVDTKIPDFFTKRGGILTTIRFNFTSLNVILHREAIINIFSFVTQLQKRLQEVKDNATLKLSENISKRMASILEDGVDVTVSEKKLVSKGKKFRKKKKTVDVIDLVVEIVMDSLSVKLTSDLRDLTELSVKGGKLELSTRKSFINIDCKLSDVMVQDLNAVTLHKMIVSSVDEQTLSMKATIFNKEYLESAKSVDVSIEAEIGRVRCVFLNWFITSALDFVNTFQNETVALREGASAAAQKAKEGVIKAYENETKVSLNIKITAPLIIIPRNSTSMEALVMDMGILTIKSFITQLEDAGSSESGTISTPLMDVIRCQLENVKLTRAVLNAQSMSPTHETFILDPVTLELTLNRNLSISWYTDMVALQIQGRLELIHVTLTHTDLCFIAHALQENFAEGETRISKDTLSSLEIHEQESSQSVVEMPHQKGLNENLAPDDAEKTKPSVIYSFLTDRFIFDTVHDSHILENGDKVSSDLAKFVLEIISLKGTIFSDGSMTTSAFLSNITIDDTRPGKKGRITNLMERKMEHEVFESGSNSDSPSMLNINYQRKGFDSFVDIRVYGFSLILSMDFMSKLLTYFSIDDLDSTVPPIQTQTKQTEVKRTGSAIRSGKANVHGKKGKEKKEEADVVKAPTFTVNVRLEKPDIIIVENMDSPDTEAIVFNTELLMKYRCAGSRQVITATLSDIGLVSCWFNPKKKAQITSQIIKPFTISLAGSTPEGQGLHIDICLTDIYLAINAKTVELINKCYITLLSDLTKDKSQVEEVDYSDVWNVKSFQDDNYWFLRTEEGVDALLTLSKQSSYYPYSCKILEEICLISVPAVVITVEDVTVKSKMPLVLFEMSVQGQIHNWSTQLSIDCLVKLQMQYFNKSLSAWEPLIEPSEIVRDNKSFFAPWELDCNVTFGCDIDLDTVSVESDAVPQPSVTATLSCSENLEITITKSFVDVLENLLEAFTSAVAPTSQVKSIDSPPYIVKNETGISMELLLEQSNLSLYEKKKGQVKVVNLESGAQIALKQSKKKCHKSLGSTKKIFAGDKKESYLYVKSSLFKDGVLQLPIGRTIKRYYPVTDPTSNLGHWGFISDINIVNNSQVITLRSILQINNYFQEAIDIHRMVCKDKELEYIGTVEGNSSFNVPFHSVYSQAKGLFFSVKGYSVSIQPLVWMDIKSEVNLSVLLRCNPKHPEDTDPFFIMAIGEVEQVYFENSYRHNLTSMCINIHLQPTLELLNSLPVDIMVCSQGTAKEKSLAPGEKLQIPHSEPGTSSITLRICNYLEKDWSCKESIPVQPTEFSVWTFTSYNGFVPEKLNIGVFYTTRRSSALYTIYCPYLMVNQTGHVLSYRFDGSSSTVYHPPTYNKPLMFSPGAKKFSHKRKVVMKVNQGEWSDKFPVDVAGSGGTIECYDQTTDCRYLIAVTITLTFNSLTKIVLLTPYYVLLNKTNYQIQCQECDNAQRSWITIEPEDCVPFWPVSEEKRKTIRLKLLSSKEITAPFYYDSTDSILLKLENKYGGLFVDIQTTNSGTNIIIHPYEPGLAPALILNHTKEPLEFIEKGTEKVFSLQPRQMCLYSWVDPTEERELLLNHDRNKDHSFNLREDVEGDVKLIREEVRYVSFLDGTQRILLFTEDKSIATDTTLAGHFENTGLEVILKIQGIGVSLVNNIRQIEILYMGFVSSGVSWETKRESRSRYKAMTAKNSKAVENAYQKYEESRNLDTNIDSIVVIDNKIQINFEDMEMLYPHKKKLRRVFEPGLWAAYRSTDNYITLHMKINRIQIDNQLHDSIFPVVLAPVPPPKTVSISNDPKPFFELSVLKVSAGRSRVQQYKYFRILIQEFSIKIDIGFITQCWSFLSPDVVADEIFKTKFRKDIAYCEEPLLSHVTVLSTTEQKNFYDLLHFSPLKVHFSFSLAGNVQSSMIPPALGVLLQSLGVTLTDLNDVLFRLSYFERKAAFLTNGQLRNEVIQHYYGQAIRQAYVLLLGLDVIGNPFGLVIGIGQGVEAFFYEPVQGIIQGPSDFATGVALGCRSLFGHTVGGTAGTLGKITGTLGKGLAVLSLDKEYQRERMEQQNRRTDNISSSMAQGGKGVVMGVYEGVAGVVMKPITGAKEEGAAGFFKGVGKGMMGLVTRPVTGVVDFASTSLNAVKRDSIDGRWSKWSSPGEDGCCSVDFLDFRATEQGTESTRIRPPRFFQDDKLVTPYRKHEAHGNCILFEVEKRKYCKTDKYEYHAQLRGKEILLLTDKRLILTEHNDVFGNWHVHLEITWTEMSAPPQLHAKGIALNIPRRRSSVFQAHKSVKVLAVDDTQLREMLFKKMQELYSLETRSSV